MTLIRPCKRCADHIKDCRDCQRVDRGSLGPNDPGFYGTAPFTIDLDASRAPLSPEKEKADV